MNFTEYLTESKEGKNLHLEHIEDQVLNRGVAGAREAINFLQSLRNMLAGHADTKMNITTKWDGAPAVFAGTNPENGKFFVGTKGIFAKNAKLNYTDDGIVFHTSYTGQKMEDMKASFNIDIGRLATTKDVWFRDASFTDASGSATFTEEETKQITTILSLAGRTFQTIPALTLNRISSSDTILEYIKTFNNTKVREGKKITDTRAHTLELVRFVEAKLNKEIAKVKREDTKRKKAAEKTEIMRFFRSSAMNLKTIFDLQNLLVDAKLMIIRKLETIKSIGTFIRTDDGFRITAPEGFVAVSKTTGGALKLVDRLEFSQANFTAAKNWSK